MIEKGKIIELEDNNEYYIIDKIDLKDKCYLYISRIEPTSGEDLCFVEFTNNKIFSVYDDSVIKDLLLIVSKKGSE
ncbi:MAG: hypothetical protein HFH31_00725 [Bacilli bacterium]|jgi:hypothetical protein|nr:hypothetical protein [Bacilli bacterium]